MKRFKEHLISEAALSKINNSDILEKFYQKANELQTKKMENILKNMDIKAFEKLINEVL